MINGVKNNSGFKKLLHKNKTYLVSSRIFQRGSKINLITLTFKSKLPIIQLRLDKNCNFQNIRLIKYKNNNPNKIISLDNDLKKILTIEDLNPIFEKAIGPTKNNLIALVDTGVNYRLNQLKNYIAVKKMVICLAMTFGIMINIPLTMIHEEIHFTQDVMELLYLVL